jgi:hypothetical protein
VRARLSLSLCVCVCVCVCVYVLRVRRGSFVTSKVGIRTELLAATVTKVTPGLKITCSIRKDDTPRNICRSRFSADQGNFAKLPHPRPRSLRAIVVYVADVLSRGAARRIAHHRRIELDASEGFPSPSLPPSLPPLPRATRASRSGGDRRAGT